MLRAAPRERAPWTVVACYAAVIGLYFTAVSIHFMWYVVPLYPLLSLFVGGWLLRLAGSPPDRATLAYLAIASALALWTRIPMSPSIGVMEMKPSRCASTSASFSSSGPGGKAMLEAGRRVLEARGAEALTTNHVAERRPGLSPS